MAAEPMPVPQKKKSILRNSDYRFSQFVDHEKNIYNLAKNP